MTASTHSRPRSATHCPGGAVGDGGAAAGLVTLAAPATASASSTGRRSINVPRDFPTIQAAVDAAAPGATIHVGPGTYTEQIPITKDLDLRGVGAAATVIQTLATLVPFGVFLPTGAPAAAVVRVGSGARAHLGPGGERTASVCTRAAGVLATQGILTRIAGQSDDRPGRVTGVGPGRRLAPERRDVPGFLIFKECDRRVHRRQGHRPFAPARSPGAARFRAQGGLRPRTGRFGDGDDA